MSFYSQDTWTQTQKLLHDTRLPSSGQRGHLLQNQLFNSIYIYILFYFKKEHKHFKKKKHCRVVCETSLH